MATCWAKCSDLFLYTKGKDVYLWRCNETTLMPMKTADFDDLGKVMDHVDLIGGKDSLVEWEKSAYIDLVAYISSRRLLVNSRGLVIAELHEFDQDGKMEENGLPIYIRSLDVLPLKPFGLRDRTIPSRTVRYLETEGKAAPVEDSNSTTSSIVLDGGKLRAEMEKQIAELEAANKTLKSDKEASDKQVKDLQDHIKSLTEKPDWMSDNNMGFVSFSALGKNLNVLTLNGSQGSLTIEDNTTNVRASYMYQFISTHPGQVRAWKGVDIDGLPKKEMARFKSGSWFTANYNGRPYVIKEGNW